MLGDLNTMVLFKLFVAVVLIASVAGVTFVITKEDDDYAWLLYIFLPCFMISLATIVGLIIS